MPTRKRPRAREAEAVADSSTDRVAPGSGCERPWRGGPGADSRASRRRIRGGRVVRGARASAGAGLGRSRPSTGDRAVLRHAARQERARSTASAARSARLEGRRRQGRAARRGLPIVVARSHPGVCGRERGREWRARCARQTGRGFCQRRAAQGCAGRKAFRDGRSPPEYLALAVRRAGRVGR